MNRRNFLKFLAKGAAIVGTAGVLGLPDVEAKEWEFNVPKYDKNTDLIYTDVWTTEQRKQFAREVIELEKELPGLMPIWEVEYSTQSGTHWPNDEDIETIELCTGKCNGTIAVLAGDMITTDGGITWTTLELGLDKDDKIINVEYVFGEIQLTTLKNRLFISKDSENFKEYWPNYYANIEME